MSMMSDKVYDAFLSVGVSEEKARAAAVELAEYDPKINALESKVDRLTWMVTTNLGLTLVLIGKVFLDGR